MPWHVERGHGCSDSKPWAVIKDADGSVEGCHPTRTAAGRQVKALYASEKAASEVPTLAVLNRTIENALASASRLEDALTHIYALAMHEAGFDAAKRFHVETAAAFNEPFIDDGYATTEAFQERAEKTTHEAALSYWEILTVTVPIAFFGDQFLRDLDAQATRILDETLRDEIRAVIRDSVEKGLSATETEAAIRAHFKLGDDATARMLARTQITTLANEGGLRAATELQAKRKKQIYKTWGTVGDNRVRPAHAETNGQTVPLEQPFNVGGFALMYPGDLAAPLRLVANCRCFLSYSEALVASATPSTLSSGGATMSDVIGEATIVLTPQIDWSKITTVSNTESNSVVVTVDDAPDVEEDQAPAEAMRWRGIITMEGMSTGDGRYFAADSWSWRELPLTLLAQTITQSGHDGAEVAGRIDRIWKVTAEEAGVDGAPEGAMAVMGEGVFDAGEFGANIARLVGDLTLRGISVDFGVSKAGLWDTEENALVEDPSTISMEDLMFSGRYERAALEAEIGAATIVSHPAFANANVTLVASGALDTQLWLVPDTPALTASGAGMAPLRPPRDWFAPLKLDGPQALHVTDKGEISGHIALWGTCHTGLPGCEQPPASMTNYRWFHLGVVECDDGTLVPCGTYTMDTGHAGVSLGWKAARAHYDNTGVVAAQVVAGEDMHGIWIHGAIHPDLDSTKLRVLRGSKPSGHWCNIDGNPRELMAVLATNMPGFPVPRPQAHWVVGSDGPEVRALVAAGIPEYVEAAQFTRGELVAIRVLTDQVDGLRSFSADERKRMAENGEALPDGSFPIANCSDASNAISAFGRAPAGRRATVRAHIRKRVKALGCTGSTFENWQ